MVLEDNSKHDDCEKAAHGEHRPQGLPCPIVIGQDSLQHGTEGDGHRNHNENLKVHPEAVKIVFTSQSNRINRIPCMTSWPKDSVTVSER